MQLVLADGTASTSLRLRDHGEVYGPFFPNVMATTRFLVEDFGLPAGAEISGIRLGLDDKPRGKIDLADVRISLPTGVSANDAPMRSPSRP